MHLAFTKLEPATATYILICVYLDANSTSNIDDPMLENPKICEIMHLNLSKMNKNLLEIKVD